MVIMSEGEVEIVTKWPYENKYWIDINSTLPYTSYQSTIIYLKLLGHHHHTKATNTGFCKRFLSLDDGWTFIKLSLKKNDFWALHTGIKPETFWWPVIRSNHWVTETQVASSWGRLNMCGALKTVYACNFARCDGHPRVCNKLIAVYAARYPLMIRCSLISTLSSVKHILQDVNRKAQNRKCK